jgi:PAS domain S-box-containing protein
VAGMRKPWRQMSVSLRRLTRLRLLFWVLVTASAALAVVLLLDLVRYLLDAHSLRDALTIHWSWRATFGPLLGSRLLLLLLLGLAWSSWLRLRRRELDDIRLRRSEQKYRAIINHAGEAIFLLDADGRVREWNKAAETLFGEPRRAALGRPFRDIHLCYGVEIERAMADVRRLRRSLNFEFPFPRAGRTQGLISLTISLIESVWRGYEAQEAAYVVIARDITSERQFETKLSETEKLAGIGQLAAGIAHQLNTPLGSILLSAQMLEDSISGEDQAEDVRRIIRQTEQCRTIIKGLLNFARPTGSERGLLNLGEVIRETAYLMEKNLKLAGIVVEVDERTEPIVHGNRNELDQVFFNLLANALDAMPGGGRIDIVIGEGAPGELLVEFADEGEGIPAANRDQVFLPFFTTKEYGKGTGLGLSIVARIVHEHGGRIEMESAEGKGTRFYLSFPKPGFGLGAAPADQREE